MVQAQEWLDKEYPLEERNKIKRLDIERNKLEGVLFPVGFNSLKTLECHHNNLIIIDISELNNLSDLRCHYNQITWLDTRSCKKLVRLVCSDNLLEMDFSQLVQPEWKNQMNWLTVSRNKLTGSIDCLMGFAKLELLHINNNELAGSLEACKTMKKLTGLFISNTKIDRGLKYLRGLPISNKELGKNFNFANTVFWNILKSYETLNEFFEHTDNIALSLQKKDERWKKYSLLELSDKIIDLSEKEITNNPRLSTEFLKKKIEEIFAKGRGDQQTDFVNDQPQLEEVVTSTQENIRLKEEIIELKQQLEKQSLNYQLQVRKGELTKLLANVKGKLGGELEFLLKRLLKTQADVIKLESNSLIQESLDDLKSALSKKIGNEKEIESICQKQKEITQLEQVAKLLAESQNQEDKLETQIEQLPHCKY